MRRRLFRILLSVLIGLALAYVPACWIGGRLIAEKAAAQLRIQLGLEVHWKWAWYRLPMGLALHGVTVSMPLVDGQKAQLLTTDYFRLDLESLPTSGEPVQIAELELLQPVLRFERQSNGVILRPHFGGAPSNTAVGGGFTLRKAIIHGGSIEYRNDLSDQSTFTTVLPEFTVECSQQSNQPLKFSIQTPAAASPSLDAAGTVGTAHRQVDVDHLTIAGDLSNATSLLPSKTAEQLRLAGASGPFRISAHGTVGLNGTSDNNWSGTLSLHDAAAQLSSKLPIRHISAELALYSSTTPGVLLTAALQRADADTDGASLHLDQADIEADADKWKIARVLGWMDMHADADPAGDTFFEHWQLRGRLDFTGTAHGPYHLSPGDEPLEAISHEMLIFPRKVAFRAPGFPRSFEQIVGGSIAFRAGIISGENLRGKYGDNALVFDSGRLILEDPARKISRPELRQRIELTDLTATLLMAPGPVPYPAWLAKTMEDLHPTGGFGLTGTLIFPHRQPGQTGPRHADYRLTVSSTGTGQLTLFDKVKVQSLEGSAVLTPSVITIPLVRGIVFDGAAWAKGTITPNGKTHSTQFAGQITAMDLQLAKIAAVAKFKPQTATRLAGLGAMDATITDTVSAAKPWYDQLQGAGKVEVFNGAFASLPVISDVTLHKIPNPAAAANAPLTVDEAAGLFTVADHRVNFQKLAISSPALGFSGAGDIGFDRSLDLTLVLAPLGDWRERARQSNIPIIGNVAGDVLGAVQKVINAATGSLINAVHVGGTLNKPVVQDIPAPAITDGLKSLFGQMLQPHQDHRLLNAVQSVDQPAGTPAR